LRGGAKKINSAAWNDEIGPMSRRFASPTPLKPNRHLAPDQREAIITIASKYLGDLQGAMRAAEVAEYFAAGRHNDFHQRKSLWKMAQDLERLINAPTRLQARLATLDHSTALALGGYDEHVKSSLSAPRQHALQRFLHLQQHANPVGAELRKAIADLSRRTRPAHPGRRIVDDNLKHAVEWLAVIWELAKGSRFRETEKERIKDFVLEVLAATGVKLKPGEIATAIRIVVQERRRLQAEGCLGPKIHKHSS
jgi:hypothetical protein